MPRDDTMAKVGRVAWPANGALFIGYYLAWGGWGFLAFSIFCCVLATMQTILREWPLEDD